MRILYSGPTTYRSLFGEECGTGRFHVGYWKSWQKDNSTKLCGVYVALRVFGRYFRKAVQMVIVLQWLLIFAVVFAICRWMMERWVP